ncbi:MAG TPA: glycosyltransferase family 87 protein [Candidatus Limnocylindria bacterium]|nr:glycosyltransferase family 87 protein [Candidatus Limnocylindria bacterium]
MYVLALVLVPMTIVGVLAATTPETTDFICFWAGPHLILDGRDPYAQAEWNAVTGGQWLDALGRFRTGNCSDRFAYPYPLTTAVAMLPFGVLPLDPAAALWELTIFITAGLGLRLIARAAALDRSWTLWFAVLVLSSEMFYGNLLNAQFGGLTLFALGLLAAPRLGPARGTAGIALAALKPHVIFLVPIVRLASMGRSAILTAAAFGALWFLASLALQPTWLAGWTADLSHRRELFNASTTLWTLESVMSAPGLAMALLVPALALLGLACWRAWPLAPIEVTAVAAIAWQLVVPYGLSYDQLGPLAVAAAVILRIAAARTRSWPLLVSALAVVVILPWVFFSRGKDMIGGRAGELEILNALVPVAMCVLLAIALIIRARSGRAG